MLNFISIEVYLYLFKWKQTFTMKFNFNLIHTQISSIIIINNSIPSSSTYIHSHHQFHCGKNNKKINKSHNIIEIRRWTIAVLKKTQFSLMSLRVNVWIKYISYFVFSMISSILFLALSFWICCSYSFVNIYIILYFEFMLVEATMNWNSPNIISSSPSTLDVEII